MAGKRVLVVDDSLLIRRVLSDALEEIGYQVDTAENGAEALKKINQSRPDLVVSDILMPAMDGWALCEAIRRAEPTRDLPFIFLTTERDVPKRIKGLEMGADDFVCKPFSKEEVVARVGSVLRRASRGGGRSRRKGRTQVSGPTHLAGHSDQISVPDVLQMLSQNGKSGTLNLRGRSVGRIYFRDGKIINAETRSLKGRKALFRLVAWPEAHFDFEPGIPERPAEPALEGSTSSVLMEGFKQLDEMRQLAQRLPRLDEKIRSKATGTEAPFTVTQRIILNAAAGGATLEEIIDAVPDDDLVACAFIDDLLQRDLLEVVRPASRARQAATGAKD